jgi:hypothetical protein
MVLDWPGEHSDEDDTGRLDRDDLGNRGLSLLVAHDHMGADFQLDTRLQVPNAAVCESIAIVPVIVDPEIPLHRAKGYASRRRAGFFTAGPKQDSSRARVTSPMSGRRMSK